MTDFIEALVDVFSNIQDKQIQEKDPPIPEIPKHLGPTGCKLAEMFMEHIPTSILDSGSAFGYRYQKCREDPVWKRPDARFEFGVRDGKPDIVSYLNTFRWLSYALLYDKDVDDKFQEWRKQEFPDGEGWEEHLAEFVNPQTNKTYKHWWGEYTYNYENCFDTNFIWYMIQDEKCNIDTNLVILQLHNGCDARGGFTQPVMFLSEHSTFYPFQIPATMCCNHCGARWDLNPYGHTEYRDNFSYKDIEDYPCEKGTEGKKGTVVVESSSKAYCPACGEGNLQ